jgi:hypothetical protein
MGVSTEIVANLWCNHVIVFQAVYVGKVALGVGDANFLYMIAQGSVKQILVVHVIFLTGGKETQSNRYDEKNKSFSHHAISFCI